MLTIDVRKLNSRKEYAGDLNFGYDAPQELIDIPYVEFGGPVQVSLHFDILEDDSVEVKGTVAFVLKGKCSRCLKDAQQAFSGEIDAYFVPDGGESEDYRYSGGKIDLSDCLNDAIMLALPSRLVCGDGCVGSEWKEQ